VDGLGKKLVELEVGRDVSRHEARLPGLGGGGK
jgi:hypothetical protein